MTKAVEVMMKSGEKLTFTDITDFHAPLNKYNLKLFRGTEVIAEFDTAEVTSWYEIPPSARSGND